MRRFLAALLGVVAAGVIGAAAVAGVLLARRLSRPVEDLRHRAAGLVVGEGLALHEVPEDHRPTAVLGEGEVSHGR